jgi:preprotein translocase subunit SecE
MKFFRKIRDYFIQSYLELRKVSWPKRSEVISYTIIVIIVIGIAMLIVAAIDFSLLQLINFVINSKK